METSSLKNQPRSGKSSLCADRVHGVKTVMEEMTAKILTGGRRALEAGRINSGIVGIPESSIRRNLHGIFYQCPYKIQTLYQLLANYKYLKFAV